MTSSTPSFPTCPPVGPGSAWGAAQRCFPSAWPSWRVMPDRSTGSCPWWQVVGTSPTGTGGVTAWLPALTPGTPSTGVRVPATPTRGWSRWRPSASPWPSLPSTSGSPWARRRRNGCWRGWTGSTSFSREPTTGSSSGCWYTWVASGWGRPAILLPRSVRSRGSRSTTSRTAGTGTADWEPWTGTCRSPSTRMA